MKIHEAIGNAPRTYRFVEQFGGYPGSNGTVVERIEDANVVSSDSRGIKEMHYPVIDLDVPVHLVPSSTPGHSHLYIDKEVSRGQFESILWALTDAGIVEDGYYAMFIKRGRADVRLPWVQKGAALNE